MPSSFNVKTIKPSSGFKYKKAKAKKKARGGLKSVLFLVFVVFVLYLFTYVLPSVDVIVVPVTQNVEKELNIQLTTDKSKANASQSIFAAKIVQGEEQAEKSFKATGEKDVGNKASGQATFYNNTGRSQPLTPNIDLINDAGIIFTVKESVSVPGAKVDEQGNVVAGEIVFDIQAKEAGEQGNVGPGRINISALDLERQSKVYGEIKTGLSGGTSKIVTVVSQEDLDNAKDELIKQLEPDIKEELQKQAGDDMVVSDKLINYDDSQIEQQVEADSEMKDFDMTLNLKARAMAYNNKELRLFLKDQILNTLPPEQTISETEFGSLEIQVENFDIELGLADLRVKATFPVAESIDLDEIQQNIMGKKQTDARRYILTLPNIKDVRFNFSLSLTDKIPESESRVRVKLGEIK